jgi:hypothetical protein
LPTCNLAAPATSQPFQELVLLPRLCPQIHRAHAPYFGIQTRAAFPQPCPYTWTHQYCSSPISCFPSPLHGHLGISEFKAVSTTVARDSIQHLHSPNSSKTLDGSSACSTAKRQEGVETIYVRKDFYLVLLARRNWRARSSGARPAIAHHKQRPRESWLASSEACREALYTKLRCRHPCFATPP